jgi:hypothetical protein
LFSALQRFGGKFRNFVASKRYVINKRFIEFLIFPSKNMQKNHEKIFILEGLMERFLKFKWQMEPIRFSRNLALHK